MGDLVIGRLLAAAVQALHLFCEHLAADHFVLELDVGHLVFQLGSISAIDHL